MVYLRRMVERHPGLRTFLAVLLSFAMVMNSVPAAALAEEVNELQEAIGMAEPEAQPEEETTEEEQTDEDQSAADAQTVVDDQDDESEGQSSGDEQLDEAPASLLSAGVMLTAQADTTYTAEFFERDMTPREQPYGDDTLYAFRYLTDSDGYVVGYDVAPLSAEGYKYVGTLGDTFTTQSGGSISSDGYEVQGTRLLHSSSQPSWNTFFEQTRYWPEPGYSFKTYNGLDQFPNYRVASNTETGIQLVVDYQKELTIEVSYEGSDTGESAPASLFLQAITSSGQYRYYKIPLDGTLSWGSGSGTYPIPNDAWLDQSGDPANDTFSDKWSISTLLFPEDKDVKNAHLEQSSAVMKLAGYIPCAMPMSSEVDESGTMQTFNMPVVINGGALEKALTPEEVLGDAYEFGIVADTYKQGGHTETNFAVKHYNHNDNFDIEGSSGPYTDVPFYIGEIVNLFRVGSGTNADLYVYTPQSEIDKGKITQENTSQAKHKVVVTATDRDEIDAYVDGMIDSVRQKSAEMAAKSTIKPSSLVKDSEKKVSIDTRDLPDNTTIYVDCGNIMGDISQTEGVHIYKKDGQTIVFNIADSGQVNIGKYKVYTDKYPSGVESTTEATNRDTAHNLQVDEVIFQHVFFNMPNASAVHTDNASAMFLAPNANRFTQSNGAGWIVCGGTVDSGSEWHFYRHNRHFDSTIGALQINKKLGEGAPKEAKAKTYKFYIREKTDEGYIYYYNNPEPMVEGEPYSPVNTSSEPVALEITGAGSYKLEKLEPPKELEIVELTKDAQISGYTLEVTNGKTSKSIVGGRTQFVNVTNTYEEQGPETGDLVITKTVDGLNITESEFEGALKFTVQNADGKYLDKDGNLSDEKVELTLKDGGFVKGEDGTYTKTFEGVAPGTYTVTETNSDVEGYDLVSGQSTTSGEGAVVAGGTATVALSDTYEEITHSVKVSKTDIADGEEVEGATIQILDKDGNVVESWTSGTEAHELEGLKTGEEYTLRETVAPDGYTVATDTTFTIDEKGNVTSSGSVTEDGILLVEDAKTVVKVSKNDIANGEELEGATIQILDENGAVVEEWVSVADDDETKETNEGIHVIEGLKTGTKYTLRETVAPEGYTVTTDTTFAIDTNGKVTTTGSMSKDGVILVNDKLTKVKVSKTDIADGEEVEGATIQIIDKDGNVVEEWVSTKEAHEIEGLKTGETYTLRETVAPEGYTIATDTTFTIDKTGKVTSSGSVTEDGILLVEDAKTSVSISKSDIADGKELEGATIQILDADGNVVESWTSGKEAHVVKGLKTGVTYTLRETVAPDGYAVTTDTTFTIGTDGKVTTTGTTSTDGTLLVEDAMTTVKVSKTDIADGKELEGATIQVIDADGNVVEEWVSTKEVHEIKGLKTGVNYTLKETVAPAGYTIASETTFSLSATGAVVTQGTITKAGVILIEDAMTKIKVSKVDIADGEEIEGAHIQIIDKDGNVVEEWTSTDKPCEIAGLKTGEEYTLRETVAPDGYTIATDTKFTVDETGKVTSTGSVTEDGILLVEDAMTKIKVSKVDIADGKELAGAKIQILDKDGKVVEEWISTDKPCEIAGLKTGVEYTLHEEVAPYGYTVAADTKFTIDEKGKVTTTGTITEDGTLLVEDARQLKTFKVTKKWVDANGKATAWPKDAKVTVEVYANGKPLDKATAELFGADKAMGKMTVELSATKTSGTFAALPVYKGVEYTVVETGVTNVTDKFKATTTGSVDKGFTVTNTFEKKQETKKTTTTAKPATKSSTSLAKTGDPMAAAGLATLYLSGIGSALATGGAIIRKRRRNDSDKH